MPSTSISKYPHRRRLDGSFVSICPRCFVTAATAATEQQLAISEKQHVCNSETLLQLAKVLARSRVQWNS
jgi:hypothetical protein